jgi:hypothetical protein
MGLYLAWEIAPDFSADFGNILGSDIGVSLEETQ